MRTSPRRTWAFLISHRTQTRNRSHSISSKNADALFYNVCSLPAISFLRIFDRVLFQHWDFHLSRYVNFVQTSSTAQYPLSVRMARCTSDGPMTTSSKECAASCMPQEARSRDPPKSVPRISTTPRDSMGHSPWWRLCTRSAAQGTRLDSMWLCWTPPFC